MFENPARPLSMSTVPAASIIASAPSMRMSGPATFFSSATKVMNMMETQYHPSHCSPMTTAGVGHATFLRRRVR